MSKIKTFLREQQGQASLEMAMIMLPLLIIMFGFISFGIAAYADVTASSAADHAARIASVDQTNPVAAGLAAAATDLHSAIGDYNVSVTADTAPGGKVVVKVDWHVPFYAGGLLRTVGLPVPDKLSGQALSARFKEGW